MMLLSAPVLAYQTLTTANSIADIGGVRDAQRDWNA